MATNKVFYKISDNDEAWKQFRSLPKEEQHSLMVEVVKIYIHTINEAGNPLPPPLSENISSSDDEDFAPYKHY